MIEELILCDRSGRRWHVHRPPYSRNWHAEAIDSDGYVTETLLSKLRKVVASCSGSNEKAAQ